MYVYVCRCNTHFTLYTHAVILSFNVSPHFPRPWTNSSTSCQPYFTRANVHKQNALFLLLHVWQRTRTHFNIGSCHTWLVSSFESISNCLRILMRHLWSNINLVASFVPLRVLTLSPNFNCWCMFLLFHYSFRDSNKRVVYANKLTTLWPYLLSKICSNSTLNPKPKLK